MKHGSPCSASGGRTVARPFASLLAGFPADGPQPPILPPRDGFLFLDREKFHASFAADLPADLGAFMADSQVPWGTRRAGRRGDRARLAGQAQLVPGHHRGPDDPATGAARHGREGRRHLSEVAGSHAVYVSQPEAVATLIAQAAAGAADR
jgi:hypothetical protein